MDNRDGLDAESRPPTRREFRVVLGGLMLALTLAALDRNRCGDITYKFCACVEMMSSVAD